MLFTVLPSSAKIQLFLLLLSVLLKTAAKIVWKAFLASDKLDQ